MQSLAIDRQDNRERDSAGLGECNSFNGSGDFTLDDPGISHLHGGCMHEPGNIYHVFNLHYLQLIFHHPQLYHGFDQLIGHLFPDLAQRVTQQIRQLDDRLSSIRRQIVNFLSMSYCMM